MNETFNKIYKWLEDESVYSDHIEVVYNKINKYLNNGISKLLGCSIFDCDDCIRSDFSSIYGTCGKFQHKTSNMELTIKAMGGSCSRPPTRCAYRILGEPNRYMNLYDMDMIRTSY